MSTSDHEHPCPSRGCLIALRREGLKPPDDMQCCVCWRREQIPGPLRDDRPARPVELTADDKGEAGTGDEAITFVGVEAAGARIDSLRARSDRYRSEG